MIALLLTAATRPVRRSGAEHADFALALSDTSWPMVAVLGTTLRARPGTAPDVVRWRDRIHARAPEMSGARSRASLARSFMSSARVRANGERFDAANDAPPSRLKDPIVGVRLDATVALTPPA